MKYEKIGKCIQLVDKKNIDLSISNLLGINITKNFMPSIANISGTDLSKYKVINRKQFATNIMHVGRDERLPISLYNDEKPSIVSPAYKVFEVLDVNELLPEYLMIEFHRNEFDRLTWFYCDSSIRGGLDWDRFCEIEIPIPHISIQKKYVELYKGLLNNQKSYENSLDDLQLICNSYIENLIKTTKPKTLGSFIQSVDKRNLNNEIQRVRGVSIKKTDIPTKANMSGVNIADYKIVNKNHFVFNPNTARMGNKICIALNNNEQFVVSKIYPVFKIIKSSELLSEYLYLWFARPDFDRYARFHSWGSARETFNWSDMCEVKLPIPSIEIQQAIVNIYNVLESRKKINEQLKGNIKKVCPVLMKGVVESVKVY